MFKRRKNFLVSTIFLTDLLMVVLAWNVAYVLRFDVINYPPAKVYHLPREATPELVALGLNAGQVEALFKQTERGFHAILDVRYAIARVLPKAQYDALARDLPRLLQAAEVRPAYQLYRDFSLWVAVLAALTFLALGIYQGRPFRAGWGSVFQLLVASGVLLMAMGTVGFFLRNYAFSRIQVAYFGALLFLSLLLGRMIVRWCTYLLRRRGLGLRRCLLVGDSPLAEDFYRRMQQHSELGLKIVGLVGVEAQVRNRTLEALPLLGTVDDLEPLIEADNVDLVVVALDLTQGPARAKAQQVLARHYVDQAIVADLNGAKMLHSDAEMFEELPIITLVQSPLAGWNLFLKRLEDVVGGVLALLLFSPCFALICLAIKFNSAGPIFYRQERMGWNGRPFRMIKFRSMAPDAEKNGNAVWAEKEDLRTTPVGALLRRTSLDELPQLINVIRGDMSLVGPRPERPVFVDEFRRRVPNYMLRLKCKAGMTGWAQINGWRGNTSLNERINHDLYYISHWSLSFDLRILLQTLFKGFIHPNAY